MSANIVVLLRDSRALPQLGSCLASKLLKMPDVEIATVPTDGVRFIVDIIAGKGTHYGVLASLVIVQTFPIEEFRPLLKPGEDTNALLAAIRHYTRLRLHEIVPGQTAESVCTKIAAEISNKLLPEEYTERND